MISTDSIDDCGLRFMLAARHHVYLMNTLPMGQRVKLQMQGLHPIDYIWAFHSEAEEVTHVMLYFLLAGRKLK